MRGLANPIDEASGCFATKTGSPGGAKYRRLCARAHSLRTSANVTCSAGFVVGTFFAWEPCGPSRFCITGFLFPSTLNRNKDMNQLPVFSSSPLRASNIIGTDVVNPKGENLGEIKEIVIDPRSGRVAFAVVSFGGFLGMGEKLFAIPLSAFEYNPARDAYVLAVSTERLDAAPGFDADNWPSMADEKWSRDLHTYYARTPYWE